MRRALTVTVLVLAAGCGSDPENSILAPGTQAVVSATPYGASLEKPDRKLEDVFPFLKPGVRVTVGFDPGFYQETEEDFRGRVEGEEWLTAEEKKAGPKRWEQGETSAMYRRVEVIVESGEYQGVSGEVKRLALRPLPR